MPEANGEDREYEEFLQRQPLETLRDWAFELARERHDVAFMWDVMKHLPDNLEATKDWALLDPVDAVREMIHLATHFREEAASPELADLLKARYVTYLADHADKRRFDQAEQRPR
jgi:hypothetical protein